MPITVQCPGCGKQYANVPDEKVGSSVRCRCGESFKVTSSEGFAQAEELFSANRPQERKARPQPAEQEPGAIVINTETEAEAAAYTDGESNIYVRKKSLGPILTLVGFGAAAIVGGILFFVVGIGGDDEDKKTAGKKKKSNPTQNEKVANDRKVKVDELDYLHVLSNAQVGRTLALTPQQQGELQRISNANQLDLRALFVDAAIQKIKGNPQPGHQTVNLTDPEKKKILEDHLKTVAPQVRKLLTAEQQTQFEELVANGDLEKVSITPQGTLKGAELLANFKPEVIPNPVTPNVPNTNPPEDNNTPDENNPPLIPDELPPLVIRNTEPGEFESDALISARKKYDVAIAKATRQLDDAMTAATAKAREMDDEDLADDLLQLHRRFRLADSIPSHELLQSAVNEYSKAIGEADRALIVAMEADIKELTKQLKIDEATELQAEMQELVFRSGEVVENVPPPENDEVAKTLKLALEKHEQAVADAKTQVLTVFDAQIKTVAETGNLDAVKQLQEQKQEFTESGGIGQSPTDEVKNANAKYMIDVRRADTELENAYKTAIIRYQKDKHIQLARDLQEELDAGVGVEGKRWYVLFRGTDPAIWNQFARARGRYANPAGSAPKNIRYLRMQLMERRPLTVIIPMNNDRLLKVSAIGTLGWNGENKRERGGYHLGIYRTDTELNFPIPDKFKGFVSVYDKGWDAHLGWGFGHYIKVDKQQALSWKGNPVKPAPIEIAVTTQSLTEEDRKFLLEDPRVRTLVPTSEEKGLIWKFTTTKPNGEWYADDYDDSLWQSAEGAFGTQRDYYFARTEWSSQDIWLRREFIRTAEENKVRIKNPYVRINHDEDAEVYLNGELIATVKKNSNKKYIHVPVQGGLRFKNGKNVIAVHCYDRSFAQYIDVGIVDLKGVP